MRSLNQLLLSCCMAALLVCTQVIFTFAQEVEAPPISEINISDETALSFLDTNPDALYQSAWQAHNDQDFDTAAKYYIALLNIDNGNQNALYRQNQLGDIRTAVFMQTSF